MGLWTLHDPASHDRAGERLGILVALAGFSLAAWAIGLNLFPASLLPTGGAASERGAELASAAWVPYSGLIDSRRRVFAVPCAADTVERLETQDDVSRFLEGFIWLGSSLRALRIFADLSQLVAIASAIAIGVLFAASVRSRRLVNGCPPWLPYLSFLALTLAILLALWHLGAWPRAMQGYSPQSGLPTTELIYTVMFQVVFFSIGTGLVTCYVAAPVLQSTRDQG